MLDVIIKLLDIGHKGVGARLDSSNFAQDLLDVGLLPLEVTNDLMDALQVLVAVDVLGHLLILIFQVSEHLLLVVEFGQSLFDIFLDVFDLVELVLVFNLLIRGLLLPSCEFVGHRLLELVPMFLKCLQLVTNLAHFAL